MNFRGLYTTCGMHAFLSYVPIFRGAYMIHQVSHNITPNHMTTSFTGVRIPFTNLPYVSEYAVAVGLIDENEVTDKPKNILDSEGNTVILGDTKTQGRDTQVSGDWEIVEIKPNSNGEVEIVNRT